MLLLQIDHIGSWYAQKTKSILLLILVHVSSDTSSRITHCMAITWCEWIVIRHTWEDIESSVIIHPNLHLFSFDCEVQGHSLTYFDEHTSEANELSDWCNLVGRIPRNVDLNNL